VISQTELNAILVEINKILDGLDKRITKLEQNAKAKPTTTRKTNT
jgi:hypothetical protein